MFYESERIIRKNQKYVKSKAYEAVRKAKQQGLDIEEILYANECALKHADVLNETQVEILTLVRDIAKSEMETQDDKTTSSTSSTNSVLSTTARSDI